MGLTLLSACWLFVATVQAWAAVQHVDGSRQSHDVGKYSQNERDEARAFMRKQLMVNAEGVQTRYPAVAKIIGRAESTIIDEYYASAPLFYGSGEYVAEYGSWGIVTTNWHVVSESNKSIKVIFPSGEYPARVVLRDEKWDLAALIIPKPQNIRPLPISIELPALHSRLWIGGYGPTEGLDDFELHSATLTNYVSLEVPKDEAIVDGMILSEGGVLYETEMVDYGVRSGDSGGPIFNEYGELAGCLWGSDKKNSMGTNGGRVALFLMEAIQAAARLRAEKIMEAATTGVSPDLVVDEGRAPNLCGKASEKLASYTTYECFDIVRQIMRDEETGEKSDAYNGLDISGVDLRLYPVSSEPLYVSGNGVDTPESLNRLAQSKMEHVRESMRGYWRRNVGGLPPSPPIYSPSYLGLQVIRKVDRPEVIESDSFDALNERARQYVESSRRALAQAPEVTLENASAERPVAIAASSLDEGVPAPEDSVASEPGLARGVDGSSVAKARISPFQAYSLFSVILVLLCLSAILLRSGDTRGDAR